MLSAYGEVLKELEDAKAIESKPQDKIEQRMNAEAVKVADDLSTEGVVKQVAELRSTIGRLLAQVATDLDEQVGRYAQITKAIGLKEKELAEIYEIQKSALSFAALLQAQEAKRDQFEQEMERRKEELTRDIEVTRADWEKESSRREVEIKERDAAEVRRRKREEEEYRYSFAREQQIAKDRAADEQAKTNREFATRVESAERAFVERESKIAEREAEYADLRTQIDGFTKQRDAAVQNAIRETTQRLAAEAVAREELLKRDFAGEKNVLLTRVAALESTLLEQTDRIVRLTQQADKAYGQVQDIAVKALEGTANFKAFAAAPQGGSDPQRRSLAEK